MGWNIRERREVERRKREREGRTTGNRETEKGDRVETEEKK